MFFSFTLRKTASIAALSAFILLGCTNNDAEAQQKKKAAPLQTTSNQAASTVSSGAKVYTLKNVQMAKSPVMPDFSWTMDGKEVKFSEYTKGKTVFLNYWATWCPPCRREIPDIIELAKEHGDKVVFIGIALENEDKASAAEKLVSAYANKSNINYINLVGDAKLIQPLSGLYGEVQAIPTTFIFGKDGKIVQRIDGSTNKEGFLGELKKAM